MLANVGELAVGAPSLPFGGKIIGIVLPVARWQLDFSQRKAIKVGSGNKPGLMGTIKTTGQKKRASVLACEPVAHPPCDQPMPADSELLVEAGHPQDCVSMSNRSLAAGHTMRLLDIYHLKQSLMAVSGC